MTERPGYQKPQAEHPFAPYVRILGKGKAGSRSLTEAEARDAFGMILRGEVEPLQLGAFLMLLRVKEETPAELAGFVRSCREVMVQAPADLQADLDWSSYAGKRQQHPWFLLSMLLLAQVGYRIFVHGCDGHTQGRLYTESAMRQLGLPVAETWEEVATQLSQAGLSYLPLRHFCVPLHDMMQLRPLLGLRSPVNTLARLINPLMSRASVQSVFHPAYAKLHQEADHLLGQSRSLVFKGESGEVEIKPQADTRLQLLCEDGTFREINLPRTIDQRVPAVHSPSVSPLRRLWSGEQAKPQGLEAVLSTTAAVLLLLRPELGIQEARTTAIELWSRRNRERLA